MSKFVRWLLVVILSAIELGVILIVFTAMNWPFGITNQFRFATFTIVAGIVFITILYVIVKLIRNKT